MGHGIIKLLIVVLTQALLSPGDARASNDEYIVSVVAVRTNIIKEKDEYFLEYRCEKSADVYRYSIDTGIVPEDQFDRTKTTTDPLRASLLPWVEGEAADEASEFSAKMTVASALSALLMEFKKKGSLRRKLKGSIPAVFMQVIWDHFAAIVELLGIGRLKCSSDDVVELLAKSETWEYYERLGALRLLSDQPLAFFPVSFQEAMARSDFLCSLSRVDSTGFSGQEFDFDFCSERAKKQCRQYQALRGNELNRQVKKAPYRKLLSRIKDFESRHDFTSADFEALERAAREVAALNEESTTRDAALRALVSGWRPDTNYGQACLESGFLEFVRKAPSESTELPDISDLLDG